MKRGIRWSVPLLLLAASACTTEPSGSPAETGDDRSPAASASPSQPAPSASEASPSDRPSGEWNQALSFGDGETQVVGERIVYGSAGFLALGSRFMGFEGGPRRLEYVGWHSGDGRAWEEIPLPDAFNELFIHQLTTSADGDFVLLADQMLAASPETTLLALRSSDGLMWEDFDSGLPDGIFIQDIERGPKGYLLVGGQTGLTNPTLWLSADGLTWEQVHEFDQTDAYIQLSDADAGDEGYVVIGRRIALEGIEYRRFAFASSDGREWVTREEPFGPDNQGWVFATSVTSVGPDWIATLGHPEGAPTAVWFSENGLDWVERGNIDAPPSTSAGVLQDTGVGLLTAVGTFAPFEGTPGFWSSTDGAVWDEVELGADAWIADLAEGPGIVAAIGAIPTVDFTSSAGIWIRETE